MAPKGKAPTPAPSQPPPEEDDHHDHLEERIKRLIEQQQEDARKEKEEILKYMEDLISNHLSPLTSRNPTPMLMLLPPGNPSGPSSDPPIPTETPVPPLPLPPPPASRTYERTPTIPSIDKLKGRSNYSTWIINVESHARHLRLWSVVQGQQGTEEQKDLARSLIILNVNTAIQHQIKNLTAAKAWEHLEKRYNTRNISQITKTIQELCHINYDKFNSIESFQQRLLTIERQITEFTNSPEEAFHVFFAAHILNGIGKTDSTIKGQIENSLNTEQRKFDDELKQHIFDKLFAFRNPHGSKSNVNAINKPSNNSKECKTCSKSHGPTCYVENPEKAPKAKQEYFRKLKEKLLSDKKTDEEEPKKLGYISSINQSDPDDLILDSGSPCHIIKDQHLFIKLQPFHRKFETANGTPIEAIGISEIQIHSPTAVNISNAYYCPEATQNLITTEQIFKRGMEIRPKGKKPYKRADLLVNGEHFFNLELKNGTIRIINQSKSISSITIRQAAAQQPAAQQTSQQVTKQANAPVDFEDGRPIYDCINVRINTPSPPASPTPPASPAGVPPQPPRREQGTNNTDTTVSKATSDAEDTSQREKYKPPKATLQEWHNYLAHISNTKIRKLHAAKLIKIKSFKHEHKACTVCCQSKATKHPSRHIMPETSRPFQRLHFDIVGGKDSLPFNKAEYRYIFVVIDDYTRYKWAFPLNRKSQAVLSLQWLVQTWKSQFPEFTVVESVLIWPYHGFVY